MKKIIHFVQIHASPAKVYEALTKENGLSGWWSTTVSADEREGENIKFTFLEGFNPVMKQTLLKDKSHVRWKCIDGHDKWADNTFDFVLHERDGETMLEFVQEYARELSDEDYGVYNFNWGYYLGSLKKLCETGTGTPFDGA